MSERAINPDNGWQINADGRYEWAEGGSSGAGMVISETEPTDKVEGMQWLNPTTGLVLFWDGEKWLEMPGGVDGADGADGVNGTDGADSNEWVMCTQDEYDALTPDDNTVYFII